MTTAKHPAQQGPHPKDPDKLSESIDKLENLISQTPATQTGDARDQAIPVLEDMVDPESSEFLEEGELPGSDATDGKAEGAHLPPEALDDLITGVAEKLAGELDSLLNILKDTLKDSITAEIRNHFETSSGSSPDDSHAKKDT
jgi:hypothetical protein